MKLLNLKSALVVGLMGTFCAQEGRCSEDSQVNDVLKTMESKGSISLCGKGNILTRTFSLRSFEGRLCKNKYYGAFAQTVCQGKSDFNGSSCDKLATEALKGQTPAAVLEEGLKKNAGKIRTLVCSKVMAKEGNSALKQIAEKNCTPKAVAEAVE